MLFRSLQLLRYFPTATLQELTFLWKDSGRRRHDPEGSTSIGALLGGLDGQPKLKLLRVCDDTFLVNDRVHHALALPALEQLIIKSTLRTIAGILSCLTILPSLSVGIEICSPATSDQEVAPDGLSTPQDEVVASTSPLGPIVAVLEQVTIRRLRRTIFQGYTEGVERLRIDYHVYENRPYQQGLFDLLTRLQPPTTHFHLSCTTLLTDEGDLALDPFAVTSRIFAAFPHLTHISIHSDSALSYIKALSPEHSPWPADPMPCLSLEELTIGFQMPRSGPVPSALRRGEITPAVAAQIEKPYRVLLQILEARLARGHRLSRLEFFAYEEGCLREGVPPVTHVDLASLKSEMVESSIEALKDLVDGPVVFGGYRFFTRPYG